MAQVPTRKWMMLGGVILAIVAGVGGGVWHALYAANPTNWTVAQCQQRLQATRAEERTAAATRLGELKAAPAVPALLACLQDPDPPTRRQVVWALGEIGAAEALRPLFATVFRDADPAVRAAAATAVGKMQDTEVIRPLFSRAPEATETTPVHATEPTSIKRYRSTRPLVFLLRDPDPTVRRQAAWALGELKDGWALEDLVSALTDPNREVQLAACGALRKLGDPRAVAALEHARTTTAPAVTAVDRKIR